MLIMILFSVTNAAILHYKNKNKSKSRSEVLAPYITDKEPDGGVQAWVDLGDRHPDFRYVI